MEIKIECACGQPFAFDVEPLNGQMPCDIQCPACGADATAQANSYIARTLLPEPTDPPAEADASPAPSSGLRINRTHTPPAPAPPAFGSAAPAPLEALSAGTVSKKEKSQDGAFVKGAAGALVASLIGMIGWFLLIKATGYEIGIIAWGVGALTGLGARILGAKGSTKLGVLAGLFAFIAIIGGQYLALRSMAENEFDKIALVSYQEELDTANAAVALTTTEDIKAFIAKQDEVAVAGVSDDRLKEFQETDLPRYRLFIAGKPSKAEVLSRMNVFKNSWSMQFEMLKASVGLFTLLWIFLGVGSAYKLGAGTND